MITPIGIDNIGGNFFWIWAVICALFVPLVYFFGVETSGRTLEQVDQMFFDEPRILMGLNKNHRQVLRSTPKVGAEEAGVSPVKEREVDSEREAKVEA